MYFPGTARMLRSDSVKGISNYSKKTLLSLSWWYQGQRSIRGHFKRICSFSAIDGFGMMGGFSARSRNSEVLPNQVCITQVHRWGPGHGQDVTCNDVSQEGRRLSIQ